MSDKVCVVTGASSGIGLETALGLARRGYKVVLVGRSPEKTSAAAESVRVGAGAVPGQVSHALADFSSLAEVRRLADELLGALPRLDVLVNNAGVWHQSRQVSRDGYEDTFAVNHLAHFVLTQRLRPLLERSAPARIVHVSSRLHRSPRRFDFDDLEARGRYRGLKVYARSKLANVLFSNELARRLEGTGVTSNSLHPGDVQTSVTRDSRILSWGIKVVGAFLDTPEEGARTSLHVATAPDLETLTGRYFERRREQKPNPLALDPELGRRLWELSARMAAQD